MGEAPVAMLMIPPFNILEIAFASREPRARRAGLIAGQSSLLVLSRRGRLRGATLIPSMESRHAGLH